MLSVWSVAEWKNGILLSLPLLEVSDTDLVHPHCVILYISNENIQKLCGRIFPKIWEGRYWGSYSVEYSLDNKKFHIQIHKIPHPRIFCGFLFAPPKKIHQVPSVLWLCWLGATKRIRPVKNWVGGVLAWLAVWSKVQACIWSNWCHCHSLSLASVKSRLVSPFWYWLTH